MSTQKSKQGERTLIRFVKQDRKRSLHDLMNEFSQSLQVPICKRSIQRRLSNLWLSQDNCCEKTDDFVENIKNRVRWCRNRLHWTIQEQWNKIIFLMKCGVN